MAGDVNVYAPSSGTVVAALAGVAAATLLLGFVLQRTNLRVARAGAWTVAAVALTTTWGLVVGEAAGVRMLALMAVAAWGMKAVVGCEARRRGRPPLRVASWCAFAAIWPGMQTRPFERRVAAPARRLFATSVAKAPCQ